MAGPDEQTTFLFVFAVMAIGFALLNLLERGKRP
jgi:hypothetical protein